MPTSLNEKGKTKALALIRQGKVDNNSAWSWDSAEGNAILGENGDDWGAYAAVHLGADSDEPENTMGHYKHPFAKRRGDEIVLFRAGIAAIRQRGVQEDCPEVYQAACDIMEKLDKKEQGKAEGKRDGDEAPGDETVEEPDGSQTRPGERLNKQSDSNAHPFSIQASLKVDAGNESSGDYTEAGDRKGPPRFEMVANTGKVPMRLEGWKYPVVMDLSGMDISKQSRPVRLHHDKTQGVGHTDKIAFENGQLVARGVISRDTAAAKDVIASGRNGFPWQASVGATAEEVEFVKSGDEAPVNGYLLKGPANIVRKSTLGEISFVDIGGDDSTTARVAAMSKDGEESVEPTYSNGSWGGAIAEVEAEARRVGGIEKLTARFVKLTSSHSVPMLKRLQAQAIEEDWSVEKYQLNGQQALLEEIRRERPMGPSPNWNPRAEPARPKVLEAALCLAFGVPDKDLAADREYGPDVVTEAYPLQKHGLNGLIAEALEGMGVHVPRGSRNLYNSILENRQRFSISAEGFSTINLPGILGNVANKVLLMAFLQVEATYNIIAEQADFSNFQIHTMYRLEHMGDFEVVGNDGELKSGTLSQDSYTNKVDTRGQLLTLTRQNIINDDLNAFRTLIAQLARKARIAAERALYAIVCEASPTFYTVARGNFLTSSTAAPIGVIGYAAAEAALTLQTDASGDPIYAIPRFVLVPPALRYYAEQLYSSGTLSSAVVTSQSATASTLPADNPFKGRFVPVSSPFLQASTTVGNSASTWYMLADPLMIPAFQMAYLDGRRAPTIETADAEFNVLGLQMRCYWDFGVAQLDYRGVVKCAAT